MSRLFRIAIDGPAASGKSTTAKQLATLFRFRYIDSGAMFRAVTLKSVEAGLDPEKHKDQVATLASSLDIQFPELGTVSVNGLDVTDQLRQESVARAIGPIASNPQVRHTLAEHQPELKIFLVANVRARAQRRFRELQQKQQHTDETLEQVMADIEARDLADRTRTISPLKMADDAVELDTSHLSIDQQVSAIQKLVYQKLEQQQQQQ
ncbi:cytidylate kinase [Absidia repens]|uniref:(d)CMP kinase n=1 Tax=Absidia repens TaxID=90262 RepID=A0A1X2IQH3_9FUNG|nr:cytidylate kinase [Absidia repens]